MLQQTRVETVIPYYKRWMAELPTLKALAAAEQDMVLKLWEGLGYYRRALNLHKSAILIEKKFNGELPQDVKSLQSFPGIGRYTAGAISSIAFDQQVPILDGNIKRVCTRLFNISTPLQVAETERTLWNIAEELLTKNDPGNFNQALMELGALICLPKNPDCSNCPLKEHCIGFQYDLQNDLPVRKEKSPQPHLQVTAAVIEKDGMILLAKRPPGGLLGGMWEFPGGKQEQGETLPETLEREIKEELDAAIEVGDHFGTYQHAYTHHKVTLHAFHCHLISEELELNYHVGLDWVSLENMESYPMGKLDRAIAKQLLSSGEQKK